MRHPMQYLDWLARRLGIRDREVAALKKKLADQGAWIERLGLQIETEATAIKDLKMRLAEKDDTIRSLGVEIKSERVSAAALAKEVAERNRRVEILQKQLTQRANRIEKLLSRVSAEQARVSAQQECIAELERLSSFLRQHQSSSGGLEATVDLEPAVPCKDGPR